MEEQMNRGANTVKAKVDRLEISVSNLDAAVSALQADVTVLKTDVSGLKTDVAELRADHSAFRCETRVSMEELRSMFTRTMVQVANMVGDIADMKRTMATKDDISMLVKRMDGFASDSEDSRSDRLRHKFRLDDHETRIARLEDKRA